MTNKMLQVLEAISALRTLDFGPGFYAILSFVKSEVVQ